MFQNLFDLFVVSQDDGAGTITYVPSTAGTIALVILVAALLIAMLVIGGSTRKKMGVQQLAIAAVALTLAVITNFYAVFKLPYGGSITLFRMFFISLIGYLYGTRAGIVTGVAYGFLDFILEPYVVHPVQLLLDYPIAFGLLGLAGVFRNQKYGIVKGYILGVIGRYLCHVLSGIIFFSVNAKSLNAIVYSLGYNATYIVPEAVLTVVLLSLPPLRNALTTVKQIAAEN